MANNLSHISVAPDGLRMRIRLTPTAQNDRIDGIVDDEQGSGILRIAIDAIPEQVSPIKR